jgi:hypothetical protein
MIPRFGVHIPSDGEIRRRWRWRVAYVVHMYILKGKGGWGSFIWLKTGGVGCGFGVTGEARRCGGCKVKILCVTDINHKTMQSGGGCLRVRIEDLHLWLPWRTFIGWVFSELETWSECWYDRVLRSRNCSTSWSYIQETRALGLRLRVQETGQVFWSCLCPRVESWIAIFLSPEVIGKACSLEYTTGNIKPLLLPSTSYGQ